MTGTVEPANWRIDDLPDFLTIDELADYMQVSKNTVYFWRREGLAPDAVMLGKHLRFPKQSLAGWLAAREIL
ncbi:helix-turn-helix domain-containing protein [Microbacterium terrisoli]|jgi:excisionase family DNA binding protein|uniref:helix-turn-helix domain-containing protein n=1 Tax=Microbacterium terrisoli TaxID=3242192 RepID=UPI00280489C4|nr:helix-turn-helix domain-containing protein [Microbacterium protaetiae]